MFGCFVFPSRPTATPAHYLVTCYNIPTRCQTLAIQLVRRKWRRSRY